MYWIWVKSKPHDNVNWPHSFLFWWTKVGQKLRAVSTFKWCLLEYSAPNMKGKVWVPSIDLNALILTETWCYKKLRTSWHHDIMMSQIYNRASKNFLRDSVTHWIKQTPSLIEAAIVFFEELLFHKSNSKSLVKQKHFF